MTVLILAFVAGVLTVLAPCMLPLLPVIVGGSLTGQKDWRKPFIITASLALSIVIFTLLLKATTTLLGVPPMVWELISGTIIIALGLSFIWPAEWEKLAARLNLSTGRLLGRAGKHKGLLGDLLTGAALGPVFTSCSPTYAFIVAAVLPASYGLGVLYLGVYALGVATILLLIALVGQKVVGALAWASNPRGWFKKAVGAAFIIVGLLVASGLQKQLESYLVSQGWYDATAEFERSLMR